MGDAPRWVIVVLAVLIVVGLVAFARGRDHHRGDDVGAFDDIRYTTPEALV